MLFAIDRNPCSESIGIAVRHRPEYAFCDFQSIFAASFDEIS
jgi:hypothetical protein